MTFETDSSSLVLRPAGPLDAAALASWLPPLMTGDWTADGIAGSLQAGHELRVLTAEAGEALGMAEFQVVLDEGHLLGIAIAPARQRRGLGKQLLRGVLVEMRQRGCQRCLLEVRRSNTAALALYTDSGFTLDGVRKNYYPPVISGAPREDALLLSLTLSED